MHIFFNLRFRMTLSYICIIFPSKQINNMTGLKQMILVKYEIQPGRLYNSYQRYQDFNFIRQTRVSSA